jgi:hypothetical protein
VRRQIRTRENSMTIQDPIAELIIGCWFRVANELGPGFREKVHENRINFGEQRSESGGWGWFVRRRPGMWSWK